MANTCYYELRAIGDKQGIEALLSSLDKIGTTASKFYRVWKFYTDKGIEEMPNNKYLLDGYGDCAWSVNDTFMKCENDTLPYIQYLSKYYGLLIEIVSEEVGMLFTEHIIIDKGDICADETRDIYSVENKDSEDTIVGTYPLTI